MIAKITTILGLAVITVLAFLLFGTGKQQDLDDTFVLDAVYFADTDTVQITFEDTSARSTSIVLEILGMDESFQRYYEESSFVENVTFKLPPKFGWKVHPVTLVIEHPEYGKIGVKTEIRTIDEPRPLVIYSRL